MNGLFEWILFIAFSLIAIVTAAGMLITMSMYRAGLALMASLVALAGLFLLLDADLLAAIQVMMNVGGMLVMILFMVMIMMDPGGEMMWGMKRDMQMKGLGAFSMTMPRGKTPAGDDRQETATYQTQSWTCSMHPDVNQDHPGTCPICGMQLIPRLEKNASDKPAQHTQLYTCSMHPDIEQDHPGTCPICSMQLVPKEQEAHKHDESEEHDMQSMSSHDTMAHSTMDMPQMSAGQNDQMMMDMAMSTAQLPWALLLGVLSSILLIVLVIVTPWPLAHTGPTQDAVTMVGELLLSRYMIGFEGAAFLILAGIAGAVILGKRERTSLQSQEHAQHTDTADTDTPTSSMVMTYTCPMHSDIKQKQPGNCPKCDMQLISTGEAKAETQGGYI